MTWDCEALRERVLSRVDASGGPDACHRYLGTIGTNGYGQITEGRSFYLVPRLLLGWVRGVPLAPDEQACHTCDVRWCVNLRHLWVGSAADNQRDKARKGRAARGERNGGGGKLLPEQVIEIRRRVAAGEFQSDVAAAFAVTPQMVGNIVSRRQWIHV